MPGSALTPKKPAMATASRTFLGWRGTIIGRCLLDERQLRLCSVRHTIISERNWCAIYSSTSSNSPFFTPQTGHSQSSGRLSKGVPGSTPPSGSPFSGSYTYPQTTHLHFFMSFPPCSFIVKHLLPSSPSPRLLHPHPPALHHHVIHRAY